MNVPKRIVVLSAEAAEWLYIVGAWKRVVGITAYANLPPRASRKPTVSGFSTALLPKIVQLKPDLAIAHCDVQADLSRELIRAGIPVYATNQRTLAETFQTLANLGRLVGCEAKAEVQLHRLEAQLAPVRSTNMVRPRIYFEEWHEPMVTCIGWVSELIERAGGTNCFTALSHNPKVDQRVVSIAQLERARPDIILASWCGKPFRKAHLLDRLKYSSIPAVGTNQIHEIPSADILQPGPGLLRGYRAIRKIISSWQAVKRKP